MISARRGCFQLPGLSVKADGDEICFVGVDLTGVRDIMGAQWAATLGRRNCLAMVGDAVRCAQCFESCKYRQSYVD